MQSCSEASTIRADCMVKLGCIVPLLFLLMSLNRVYSFLRSRHTVVRRILHSQAVATPADDELKFSCRTDWDIEWMGKRISRILSPGDVLLLRGDLGAGKTTFSRGIVRAKFEDDEMVVTSPSYLLDNTYTYGPDEHIHHMDLYRLPPHADMGILGIPAIFNTAVCLVEWPERLPGNLLPASYLDVSIGILDGSCVNKNGIASIIAPPPPSSSLETEPSDTGVGSDHDSDDEERDSVGDGNGEGAANSPGRIVTLWCVGERWVAKKDMLKGLLSSKH